MDIDPVEGGRMPTAPAPVQSESSPVEEETPALMWGLDPVFLAFARLYIRDILDMKESQQVPGMWLNRVRDGLAEVQDLSLAQSWGQL